ncbi:Protein of unknown function [Polaromonas sp. OV174]|uniref:DUF2798 domain-containing protein n=1 Tax=Polaromonas sp. OV174 TaxID=1855300 RepID=UPI0008E4B663|nr:DUF2798 domain-containing protein [Polaromonas sp. OV174]SFB73733.1 Protein of unknown function [Polaromonas sp. OV174]
MTQANTRTKPQSSSSALRRILPDLVILPSIALILSAIMSWANVGFGDEFLSRWGWSFLTSVVVLPVILACLGVIDRAVAAVLSSAPVLMRKLVVVIVTAVFIESILALAVTAINGSAGGSFALGWWLAFSRSIPAGLVISSFFVFYMKPKLERLRAGAQRST